MPWFAGLAFGLLAIAFGSVVMAWVAEEQIGIPLIALLFAFTALPLFLFVKAFRFSAKKLGDWPPKGVCALAAITTAVVCCAGGHLAFVSFSHTFSRSHHTVAYLVLHPGEIPPVRTRTKVLNKPHEPVSEGEVTWHLFTFLGLLVGGPLGYVFTKNPD